MAKEKGVSMKVNKDFRDTTVEGIVKKRIDDGLETRKKPISYCQVTKIMHNFFEANPKLLNKLCEVKINGN